jgi:hypothetical protein
MEQNAMSEKVVRQMGEIFWSRARMELDCKLEARKEALNEVLIPIPETARSILLDLSRTAAREVNKDMKRLVARQKIFDNKNTGQKLLRLHSGDIAKTARKWMALKGAKAPAETKKSATDFFGKLLQYKKQVEVARAFQRRLEAIPAKVAARIFLAALFDIAFILMHQCIWGVVRKK